jgi:hypothetical protein
MAARWIVGAAKPEAEDWGDWLSACPLDIAVLTRFSRDESGGIGCCDVISGGKCPAILVSPSADFTC